MLRSVFADLSVHEQTCEQKDVQTLSVGCFFIYLFIFLFFALNSLKKSEARSEISGDVLSSLPPPPPPLPPTSPTSCTSWGRAMWRAEGGRAGGVERKTREEKQIKSHKLFEMSLSRCEKPRREREKMSDGD